MTSEKLRARVLTAVTNFKRGSVFTDDSFEARETRKEVIDTYRELYGHEASIWIAGRMNCDADGVLQREG
jgi:hypothetical protein